jgi:hypothetical protein
MQRYIGGPIPTSARFSRSFLGLSRKRTLYRLVVRCRNSRTCFPTFQKNES